MSSNVQDPSVETLFNPTSSLLVPPITPSVSNALLQQSIAHRLPALDPSLSAHPQSTLKIAADQSARFSHAPAVWDAAEEYVRSHMARNTNNTTPATVPKARAKTGGRRGRGGRRSTNKVEVQSTNTELNGGKSTHVTPDTSGRGKGKPRGRAGGRPRVRPIGGSGSGAKRKRDRSEEDVLVKDDTDASETFTPLPTQSRSGRRIFKAATFTPVTIDLESPTPMKSPLRTGKVRIADAGKRVKTQYRKVGDASVCKNCGRGHSPIGNVIVFCDGCNTPWHQYCHDKPISVEVVQIEEKEWFCTDCTILKQEKSHLEGNVGAEGMSISDKRVYLQSLSPSHLISLLLHATTLHPNLPIFSATRTSSALPANPSAPAQGSTTNTIGGDHEDTYDLYAESDPLPYPKAGNGIPLPPESEDLAFLIDDDVVTFSHCWDWDKSGLFGTRNINGDRNIGWGSTMVDVSG